jgi:nucleotide-binding universal stress UspA family protein
MDERLLAAYRATDYRVRLPRGGWASIRVGEALPDALGPLVGDRPWSFVTAWNPRSRPMPRAANRQAQRALLAALRERSDVALIRAGIGAGSDWREPSLFVVGPGPDAMDTLALRFDQNAYVHGHGRSGRAALRSMDKAGGLCGQSPG